MTARRPPYRLAGNPAAVSGACAAALLAVCAAGAGTGASAQEMSAPRPEVEVDRAALDALGPAAASPPSAPGRGADGLPLYDPRNGPPRSHLIGRFAEDLEARSPAPLRRPPPRVPAAAEADPPPAAAGTPPAPSIPGALPERPARVPPMPALPGDPALSMGTVGSAAPALPPAPAPVVEDSPPAEAVAATGEPETMETPPDAPAAEPEPDAAPPAEAAAAGDEPEAPEEAPPAAAPAPEPEDTAAETPVVPPAEAAVAGDEPEAPAETPPAAAPAPEPEDMAAETPPAPTPLPTPTVDELAAQDAAVAGRPPPAVPPPDGVIRIVFAGGDSELSGMARAVLDSVAGRLAADPTLRIVLKAYASAEDATASAARRLSLMRALAARSHLIDAGIDATRIDVRALGAKYEDGPPDRVDIVGIA